MKSVYSSRRVTFNEQKVRDSADEMEKEYFTYANGVY